MKELSNINKEVLHYIIKFKKENRRTPTNQEIQENFNWKTPASAQQHLNHLADKGYIKLETLTRRNIKILKNTLQI